jgi:hypothetical protein
MNVRYLEQMRFDLLFPLIGVHDAFDLNATGRARDENLFTGIGMKLVQNHARAQFGFVQL